MLFSHQTKLRFQKGTTLACLTGELMPGLSTFVYTMLSADDARRLELDYKRNNSVTISDYGTVIHQGLGAPGEQDDELAIFKANEWIAEQS